MNLDIRIPIGLLFLIIGLLLLIFGGLSDTAIYQRSLGINVNVLWGAVLAVFSLAMLGSAWVSAKRKRRSNLG